MAVFRDALGAVFLLVGLVLAFMGCSALGYFAFGDTVGGYVFALVVFVAVGAGLAWLVRRLRS